MPKDTLTKGQQLIEAKAGRPFEEELRRLVEESKGYNVPLSHLCGELDVAPATAQRWLKQYDLTL